MRENGLAINSCLECVTVKLTVHNLAIPLEYCIVARNNLNT